MSIIAKKQQKTKKKKQKNHLKRTKKRKTLSAEMVSGWGSTYAMLSTYLLFGVIPPPVLVHLSPRQSPIPHI